MAKVNEVKKMIDNAKTHYIMDLFIGDGIERRYLVRLTGSKKNRKGNVAYSYEVFKGNIAYGYFNGYECLEVNTWKKMDEYDITKYWWPKTIKGMEVNMYDTKTDLLHLSYNLRELNMKDDAELIIDHEITYALFQ